MKRSKSRQNPLVSVVIPFRNHEDFLEEAVRSVQNQTYGAWELIIVNDASSRSEAKKLLKQITLSDERIRVFHEKTRRGPAFCRNKAVDKAKGAFVLFLDADDKIDRTFLEKSLMVFEQYPHVAFVYTYIQHFGENREMHPTICPYNFYEQLWQNRIPYCSIIRRTDFLAAGGFNEELKVYESEDWDFWLTFGSLGYKGFCIPEPLFWYRKGENRRLKQVQKHYDEVVHRLRKRHKKLFYPWVRWELWWEWRQEKPRKPLRRWARYVHKLPRWARRIVLKFHEAELTSPENWNKSWWTCLQLMIPIRLRKIFNFLWGDELFTIKLRFSEVLPPEALGKIISLPEVSTENSPAEPIAPYKKTPVLIFLPWTPLGGVEQLMLTILRHLSQEFEFLIFTTEQADHTLQASFSEVAAVYHLDHLFAKDDEKRDFILYKIQTLNIERMFIVNSLFAFRMIPFLKNLFPQIKISTSLHGWDEQWDFLRVAALYLPFLDHVVCVSESVRKRFETYLRNLDDRVLLVRNTLDFRHLDQQEKTKKQVSYMKKESPEQKNIIFLGRYAADKNPHLIVDIAHFLVQDLNLTHYRFFLFGEGVEKESLKQRAQMINKKAGKKVVFVQERQEDIASVFHEADLLINTSPREGFGISALESIYFGVPVVAWDLDVFQEILPQQYFYPVDKTVPFPLEAFVQQIFSATQSALTQEERRMLRTWVKENFGLPFFLEQYRQIFSDNRQLLRLKQTPLELIF